MSYIDKILLPDERVLCLTTIHWIVYSEGLFITILGGVFGYVTPILVSAIAGTAAGEGLSRILGGVSFFIILIGTFLLIMAYIRQLATELAVTNRRVIAKYGLVSRTTYEIMVDRITGANFDQTFMGRLLGYGTVIIHGAGGDISPFDRIGNPEGFHKAVMQVLERGQTMVRK
jgi:uncharacterized membrane protein YdbT with pleckstrin-like domain